VAEDIENDVLKKKKNPFPKDMSDAGRLLIRWWNNYGGRSIMTSIHQVVRAYQARGFRICNILADGGFECIRNSLADMGISLNVASRNEHVPEVERYIRTIKERVRAIACT